MYSLVKLQDRIYKTFAKAGYVFDQYDIQVKINPRLTSTLGRCKSQYVNGKCKPYMLEFSKQMLETASEKTILDVIDHECAHALVTLETGENQGHNKIFKAMCAKIGTTSDGTKTKVELEVPEEQLYKYFVICKDCGKIVGKYHKAGKVVKETNHYRCNCGGSLNVVQNF